METNVLKVKSKENQAVPLYLTPFYRLYYFYRRGREELKAPLYAILRNRKEVYKMYNIKSKEKLDALKAVLPDEVLRAIFLPSEEGEHQYIEEPSHYSDGPHHLSSLKFESHGLMYSITTVVPDNVEEYCHVRIQGSPAGQPLERMSKPIQNLTMVLRFTHVDRESIIFLLQLKEVEA